ncbi:MAG: hypothetical protein JRE24_06015 [Deltaproteobacteria bacterium]|nr:hypothetical protein [Deltaproteobacteria bacterium]
MEPTDQYECLSCGWRGEARELKDLKIKLQASPMNLEEKACPKCKSIAIEKINSRRRSKLL